MFLFVWVFMLYARSRWHVNGAALPGVCHHSSWVQILATLAFQGRDSGSTSSCGLTTWDQVLPSSLPRHKQDHTVPCCQFQPCRPLGTKACQAPCRPKQRLDCQTCRVQ